MFGKPKAMALQGGRLNVEQVTLSVNQDGRRVDWEHIYGH